MCQVMVDKKAAALTKLNNAQVKRDDLYEEQVTLEESKEAFDSFITLLDEYINIYGDYSSSLQYIGYCLKYVIINDQPFDKDKCIELADAMIKKNKKLKEILSDFKTERDDMIEDIAELKTKITKYDTETIPKRQTEYDEIDENSDCGECAECLAKYSTPTTSTTSTPSTSPSTRAVNPRHIRGACFLAGTKVHTKDGLINIEEIKENDYVLSYDIDNKENTFSLVKKLFVHENNDEDLYELSINNKILKVTEKHRFYIVNENGFEWIAAKNLKVNDKVKIIDDEICTIDSIKSYSYSGTVYNLEVEKTHNYYVSEDGILVHNVKSLQ